MLRRLFLSIPLAALHPPAQRASASLAAASDVDCNEEEFILQAAELLGFKAAMYADEGKLKFGPGTVDAKFMDNVAKKLGLVLHESYYRRIA